MSDHEWVEHDGAYHCFKCRETRYTDVNLHSGDCVDKRGLPPCPRCAELEADLDRVLHEIQRIIEVVTGKPAFDGGVAALGAGYVGDAVSKVVAERDALRLAVADRDTTIRLQDARHDELRAEVARLTALVEMSQRDIFKAGYLATVDRESPSGWSFTGPAAADREPEAWAAWQREGLAPTGETR